MYVAHLYLKGTCRVPNLYNKVFGTPEGFLGNKLNLFCQNYSDKIILVEYFLAIFAVDGINYGQLYQSVLCRGKDSSRIFL